MFNMPTPTLVTFILYLILLLGIGFYFYRRSVSIEDYLLGGRGMGAWVTALSAQASDMSGWLLMALPGVIYAYGMWKVWIAIGLFVGTVLNWKLVSSRLRVYTQKTNTITLPCFFEERFGDPTGKLFESTFNVQYETAVIIGGFIIIAYTFLGGFLAVCWTDLFQGSLMILALVIVPVVACINVGGIDAISKAMTTTQKSLIPQQGKFPILMIISMMDGGWGISVSRTS